MNTLRGILRGLQDVFFPPQPAWAQPAQVSFEPITVRILSIIHNPQVASEGGRKLSEVFPRWNDPDWLAANFITDIRDASYGYVNYEIVERVEVDGFPIKKDGFSYQVAPFVQMMRQKSDFHEPDAVDYLRIIDEFDVISKVSGGHIDEVWLFGMPYAGYYESIMGGPDAIWCNAPPLQGTQHALKRFIIMGYNYERGVGEMLENMGHRVESIMHHVWRNVPAGANLWQQFTRYDKKYPGLAECGNVHFAPNSERDYDWGNPRFVPSFCDDWLNFPVLNRQQRMVNTAEWGGGDTRLHHLWWLRHLPHAEGSSQGISNNWWEYVMQPERA